MKKLSVSLFLLSFATFGWADDALVAYLKSSDVSGVSSMTNAARWGVGSATGPALGAVGAPLPADYDYVVGKGLSLRTPLSGFSFTGRSLTIESGTSALGGLFVLARDGNRTYDFPSLTLKSGFLLDLSDRPIPTLTGRIDIMSTADAPVCFADCHRSDYTMVAADVHGGEDAALWICARLNYATTWLATNSTFRFAAGSLADYRGLITLNQFAYNSRSMSTTSVYRAELRSETVTTPARIVVNRHCHIGGWAPGDVFAMDSLSLEDGAVIDVPFDAATQTAALLVVTNVFAQAGTARINFDFAHLQAGEEGVEILKVPAGTTLDPGRFTLDTPLYPIYDIKVRMDADGRPTLFVRTYQTVNQTIADTSSDERARYTFVSGAHWGEDEPPAPNKVYVSTMTMANIGAGATAVTNFGGRALFKSGSLDVYGPEPLTIDDLRIYGTSGFIVYAYSSSCTLAGHILNDRRLTTASFMPTCLNGNTMTIASAISGDQPVTVKSANGSTGVVRLTGDNSGFAGRLQIDSNNSPISDGLGPQVEFASAVAWGGALSSWHYDYHKVRDYARITPLSTMTLDRANCGFLIDGPFTLNCPDGVTFTLKEHVTWNGVMTKRGAGALVLGGDAPNFVTADGTEPAEGRNRLVIAEGALKIASAEVLQGVEVEMSSGTELVLDMPTCATSGIGRYGLHSTRSGSALVLPEGGVTVRIDDSYGFEVLPEGVTAVPICTVGAATADAIRGKLKLADSLSGKYRLAEIPNGNGEITFAAKSLGKGLKLLFFGEPAQKEPNEILLEARGADFAQFAFLNRSGLVGVEIREEAGRPSYCLTKAVASDDRTAWRLASEKFAVRSGEELEVSLLLHSRLPFCPVRFSGTTSSSYLTGIVWYDANGREVTPVHTIPFFLEENEWTVVVDRTVVPDGAAQAMMLIGANYPDLDGGQVLAISELKVRALRPGVAYEDDPAFRSGQFSVERLSESPTEQTDGFIRLRVHSRNPIDWSTVVCKVDGRDDPERVFRYGDVIYVRPADERWACPSVVELDVSGADTYGNVFREEQVVYFGPRTAKNAVTLRDDGCVLVDGEPFFPIGVYGIYYYATEGISAEQAILKIKDAGLNLVQSDDENILNAADRHGVKAFVSPGGSDFTRSDFYDTLLSRLTHPSVLAWYIGDDTSAHFTPRQITRSHRNAHALDPAHITTQAENGMDNYAFYVNATDAVLPELYPVKKEVADGTEVPSIIRDMKKITGAIRAAGSPVRSVWPIIQYFMGSSWLRYPTAEELRVMSWLGIIHGGNGITWYFYAGDTGKYMGATLTPEHWATFSAVTREVASYSEDLVARNAAEQPTVTVVDGPATDKLGYVSVSCLLKDSPNGPLLIMANSATSAVSARIDFPDGRASRTFDFAPYGVVIERLAH